MCNCREKRHVYSKTSAFKKELLMSNKNLKIKQEKHVKGLQRMNLKLDFINIHRASNYIIKN